MRNILTSFCVSCLFTTVAFGSGGELGEAFGANSLSMGWTAVANPYDNASITVNPAMLSLEERYDLLAGASYGPHPYLGWNATLADSKTSEWVALGVSYQRQYANPELTVADLPGWVPDSYVPSNERLAHDVTLAVASAVLDRKISLGVNGTFVSYEHDRHGNGVTGNIDVGLGFRPLKLLTIGFVGRNILPIEKQSGRLASFSSGIWLADPEVGALGFEIERKLEPVSNYRPYRIGAGLESAVGTARVRTGYRWDATASTHWMTGGIGASNELGGVEYGIAVPLRQPIARAIHQVSLRWSIPTELKGQ